MFDRDKKLKEMIESIKSERGLIRGAKSVLKDQEKALKELEDDFLSLAYEKLSDECEFEVTLNEHK